MAEEDKGYGASDVDPVHQSIVNHLEQGYSPQDIVDVLKTSPKPEHQAWYNKYKTNLKDQDRLDETPSVVVKPGKPSTSGGTSMLDWADRQLHDLTPAELGLGVAGTAATFYIGKKAIDSGMSRLFPTQENILKKQGLEALNRQNDISEKKLEMEQGVDPYTAHKMELEKRKFAEEQRRQEELHQAKLAKMQGQPAPANNPVSPELAGKTTDPVAIAEKASGPVTPANADINAPAPVPVQAPVPPAPQSPAPNPAPPEQENVSQELIDHILGKSPAPPVPSAMPTGQQIPNPPASGDDAHPLTNPGEEAGKTPLEATTQATEDKTDYENLFRETPKEVETTAPKEITTKVESTEKPFNEGYAPPGMKKNAARNKVADEKIGRGLFNWLQGQEGANAEKVYRELYGEGNKPYNEENVDKYHFWKQSSPEGFEMTPAEEMVKRGAHKRQAFVPESMKGHANVGAMASVLAAGGTGALIAYMMKNHPDFATHYEKALKSMGESTNTEGLVGTNKAEELSPAMRQIFMKSGNPAYRRELNEQLATEKEPGRIAELQRELEKAK